jgi:hypothetical protein
MSRPYLNEILASGIIATLTVPSFNNISVTNNEVDFYAYTTLSKFQFDSTFTNFSFNRIFFTYS